MINLLARAAVWTGEGCAAADIALKDGLVKAIAPTLPHDGEGVLSFSGCYIFPGLIDVHVHLREPGFFYKESMASGTRAAAAGGYTTVCPMPNLNPVPDSPAHLQAELDCIRRDARVRVRPYAAITRGQQGRELADLAALAPLAVAFSDDGKGVQDEDMMRRAMLAAKACGRMIVAHCEDESLLNAGYIHDGAYARRHGHPGISSESEWRQLARDLRLVAETGCAYHMCHVSTKESVALLREAIAAGLDVSAETAPHYLLLTEDDLQEDGRFKMNPPLREQADREALIEGLLDGVISIIATDHAPHSAAEKGRGLAGSAMGISGLEIAFPLLYTGLVRRGIISLDQLLALLHTNPRRRFQVGSPLAAGQPADLCVFDLDQQFVIDPQQFHSQGRATPFAGWEVRGRCLLTLVGGEIVHQL